MNIKIPFVVRIKAICEATTYLGSHFRAKYGAMVLNITSSDNDDNKDAMLTSNTSEMFCADSILFFLAPTTSMDSVNSVQRCGANSLDSSWPELGHILVWDTCTQAGHVSRAVNRTSRSCSASVLTSMEQLGSVDWTLARKFFSWVGEKQFCG